MSKWGKLSEEGEKRQAGSRHLRRKAEAQLRKMVEGKSIPALKKLIRRRKKK